MDVNLEDVNQEEEIPRRVRTPSGTEIDLNDQQHEALVKMVKWSKMPRNVGAFTLSGYAGTGKTTIVFTLLHYVNVKVCVSAPTHKAKKVITRTTNRPAQTIQSLLGLGPNVELENFDPNKPQFKPKSDPKIRDYDLVVIDEASMLSKELFDYLIQQAEQNGTKLLFMGDKAQLPPVGEKMSPVFTSDLVKFKAELTKVERQKDGNPLMLIYDLIRENMGAPVDVFQHITQLTSDGQGIEFLDSLLEFKERIRREFSSPYYQEDPDYAKITCWTNAQVKEWNRFVREMLFGPNPEALRVGEIMMAYSTVGYADAILLENSADYRIEAIKPWTDKKQYANGWMPGGKQRKMDNINIDMWEVRVIPMDIEAEFKHLRIHRIINIVVPSQDNYRNFLKVQEYELNKALTAPRMDRKRMWAEYYQFKETHLLLTDIKEKGGKLKVKKDLDYAYAITVHKSQGSTYKLCFVDGKDIAKNKDNHTERNSLLYVALSRPRISACVYTSRVDKAPEEPKIDEPAMIEEIFVELQRRRDILEDTDSPNLKRFAKGLDQYMQYCIDKVLPKMGISIRSQLIEKVPTPEKEVETKKKEVENDESSEDQRLPFTGRPEKIKRFRFGTSTGDKRPSDGFTL